MGMIYAPPSIIPNGALINNVCHIYQSTKPTTRPDGSALVVGDKWYNIATGGEGFWNGTYWLSLEKQIHCFTPVTISATTDTVTFAAFSFKSPRFFLSSVQTSWAFNSTDPSNTWTLKLRYARRSTSPVDLGSQFSDTPTESYNAGYRNIQILNQVFRTDTGNSLDDVVWRIGYLANKIGSPNAIILFGMSVNYHDIL